MNITALPATNGASVAVSQHLEQIRNADWSRLASFLLREGLTTRRCAELTAAYHKWLALRKYYGFAIIPPTDDIDVAWHCHILDTRHYCDFCERIFGCYMHHGPELDRKTALPDTTSPGMSKLWQEHFRESLPGKVSVICR